MFRESVLHDAGAWQSRTVAVLRCPTTIRKRRCSHIWRHRPGCRPRHALRIGASAGDAAEFSRGLLPNIRIGWLHTAFSRDPSEHLEAERLHLSCPRRTRIALARGRRSAANRGCHQRDAVRIAAFDPGGRQIALARLGLDPDTPTLLLTGGKEGAGDYPAVLRASPAIAMAAFGSSRLRHKCQTSGCARRAPGALAAAGGAEGAGCFPTQKWCRTCAPPNLLITKSRRHDAGRGNSPWARRRSWSMWSQATSGKMPRSFVRLGLAELATHPDQTGKLAADILSTRAEERKCCVPSANSRKSPHRQGSHRCVLDDSPHPGLPASRFRRRARCSRPR